MFGPKCTDGWSKYQYTRYQRPIGRLWQANRSFGVNQYALCGSRRNSVAVICIGWGGATVGLFVAYQRGGVLPIKSGCWCAAFYVLVRTILSFGAQHFIFWCAAEVLSLILCFLIGRRSATVCGSAQSSAKSILETPRRICTPVATAFGGSLRSGDMRLRFGAAFGTICVGETHGACED